MTELAQRTNEAIARTQAIMDDVCGSCGNSCCHQGTMMGSHDVLRLLKGMRLRPQREEIVREGLRERAAELRADLDTLRKVKDLIAAASGDDEQPGFDQLDGIADDWEAFCDLIEGDWTADAETLQGMLKFAGIRALALRAVSAFEGGHAALSTLAQEGSSFKFRGRRLAPPRCLFHSMTEGCLASRWKPGKCANFFCGGDPNVLRVLRVNMAFEDFVLGNAVVLEPQAALRTVTIEHELGREFVEPKVFIGLGADDLEKLRAILNAVYATVTEADHGIRFMESAVEIEVTVSRLDSNEACLFRSDAIDGAALYELSIGLDRFRAAGQAVPFVLVADEFIVSSTLAHPLWSDEEMAQPLGVLDLYVVDG